MDLRSGGAQSLALITPPNGEPLDLSDVVTFLRVSDTSEEALLSSLITAARKRAETQFDRAYLTQVWDLFLDAFPRNQDGLDLPIVVPRWPLQSVASVNFTPYGQAEQVLSSTNYTVDTGIPGRGRVVPNSPLLGTFVYAGFGLWPTDQLVAARGVRVRFTAGYASTGDIPEQDMQHLRLLVTHWYQHRDADQAVPPGIDALLADALGVPWYA